MTDAYTALVLNSLGYSNIVGLDSKKTSQIFSPLIGEPNINVRDAILDAVGDASTSLLINSRFWGYGSLEKFGVEDKILVPEVDENLRRFINNGKKRNLESTVVSLYPLARAIVDSPLVEISGKRASHFWNKPLRLEKTETPDISYYRDSAIITIPNLLTNKTYSLDVSGVGDFLVFMIKKESYRTFRNLPLLKKDSKYFQINGDREIVVKIDHESKHINLISNVQLSNVQFFVTLDTGHLNGLGEIKEVKIE